MNNKLPIHFSSLLFLGLFVLMMGCSAKPASHPQPAASAAGGTALPQVYVIVSQQLGVDPSDITADTSLAELKADELDFIELIMEIEDQFNVTIDDDAAHKMMGTSDWKKGMPSVTMSKLAQTIEQQLNSTTDNADAKPLNESQSK